MKPAAFAYVRPVDIGHAVDVLGQYGDEACILAGGQSLIAMMNMRLVEPRVLVDVSRLPDMGQIASGNDTVTIPASVTQSQALHYPDIAATVPLLAKALPYVGHFQTRNKGTVCGSIAHADPSSELPLCLALLDGDVELSSAKGRRTVKGAQFFTGLLQTARQAGEILTQVSFPACRPGEGHAFHEVSPRHGGFALVAVAARVTAAGIRVGIAGACDVPHVRDWPVLEGSALDDALNALAWELEFQGDVHATAKTRRHLVRSLGRRTVLEARSCLG